MPLCLSLSKLLVAPVELHKQLESKLLSNCALLEKLLDKFKFRVRMYNAFLFQKCNIVTFFNFITRYKRAYIVSAFRFKRNENLYKKLKQLIKTKITVKYNWAQLRHFRKNRWNQANIVWSLTLKGLFFFNEALGAKSYIICTTFEDLFLKQKTTLLKRHFFLVYIYNILSF